jgi:hypothetical protein
MVLLLPPRDSPRVVTVLIDTDPGAAMVETDMVTLLLRTDTTALLRLLVQEARADTVVSDLVSQTATVTTSSPALRSVRPKSNNPPTTVRNQGPLVALTVAMARSAN